MTGAVSPARPVAPRSSVRSQPPSRERAELQKAAEGFEAIMLRRMLATARASSFAEDTPLTGGGMKQFAAMRDEHLADIASRSGAFGFARSIAASLAQHLPVQDIDQGDS